MDSALLVERMYYIVDSSGNYYRVNAEDQLIASQNRDNADLFALKEANKRINSGRKMNFYSILPAEDVSESACNQEKEVIVEDMQEAGYEYDFDRLDWKDFLTHLSYVISGLKKYQDKLSDDLSEVDLCICDLMHYLELYELSEVDYIRTASLLKKYRTKRRVIKDKYNIVEWFQNAIGTQANLSKVKSVIKQIEKLDSRVYTPRMLPEVFENGKMVRKGYEPIEEPLDECYEISEEPEMIKENLERVETKFDNGENDWLRMAEEQAQFFDEARQYACNLQITMNEIDAEIEQIMQIMEETNYNAAEGYKTLKKLQSLRNERKQVKKELESVQTIIGCFACEEMRDAYQYCADRIRNM